MGRPVRRECEMRSRFPIHFPQRGQIPNSLYPPIFLLAVISVLGPSQPQREHFERCWNQSDMLVRVDAVQDGSGGLARLDVQFTVPVVGLLEHGPLLVLGLTDADEAVADHAVLTVVTEDGEPANLPELAGVARGEAHAVSIGLFGPEVDAVDHVVTGG